MIWYDLLRVLLMGALLQQLSSLDPMLSSVVLSPLAIFSVLSSLFDFVSESCCLFSSSFVVSSLLTMRNEVAVAAVEGILLPAVACRKCLHFTLFRNSFASYLLVPHTSRSDGSL